METVLVVDDEAGIRAVVRGMLEAKGYAVLDTADPHQALRIATQQPVHLLLTDVVMPLMKGTELADRLQALSLFVVSTSGSLRGREQPTVERVIHRG